MNAKLVLSSVLLAAFAGSALADDPTVVDDHFQSTKTRAEVNAELKAFQAAGVNPWATSYQPLKSFHGTATRAAVQGEYLAARNEVRALTGEDSGSVYLSQTHWTAQPAPALAGAESRTSVQ